MLPKIVLMEYFLYRIVFRVLNIFRLAFVNRNILNNMF